MNPVRTPFGEEQRETSVLTELSAEDARRSRERTIAHLRLLWSKRRLLTRVFFWSIVVSTAIAFLIPNEYQATTELMPPDNQSASSLSLLSSMSGRAGLGSLGGIAGDLLGMKNSGALFVGIVESRTVRDQLIQQFELARVYRTRKIEDTRDELARHTAINEDRKSGIITISVRDKDPQRAAAMAQCYVQELDRLVAQVSTSSARRERIFLEERLHSVKQELDAAAQEFSEFASKNTAIDIPAQGKAMVEAAARLQGELIAAESQLRGLQAIYTNENVRVRSLQARVAELHSQLEKLGGDPSNAESPGSQSSSIYPSIRKLPLLGVRYADLYRNTKIEETVFELLTQQYELAKVQEAKEIPNVKVLDTAVVPTRKVFPHRLVLIVISVFLCVALTCVFLVAGERWRRIDPGDAGKQFWLEVTGGMRMDLERLAPEGSAMRSVMLLMKIPLRAEAHQEPSEAHEPREKPAELSRTAGSAL